MNPTKRKKLLRFKNSDVKPTVSAFDNMQTATVQMQQAAAVVESTLEMGLKVLEVAENKLDTTDKKEKDKKKKISSQDV